MGQPTLTLEFQGLTVDRALLLIAEALNSRAVGDKPVPIGRGWYVVNACIVDMGGNGMGVMGGLKLGGDSSLLAAGPASQLLTDGSYKEPLR